MTTPEKITFSADADAIRYMLIELHGRLERWSSPEIFEDESIRTRLKDPGEIAIYNRLARAFNQIAMQYTEQRDDLPRMMIESDEENPDDQGKWKTIRYWPEDPFELPR